MTESFNESISGCHWTPTTKFLPSISIDSIIPSGAVEEAIRLLPRSLIAWWWALFTMYLSPKILWILLFSLIDIGWQIFDKWLFWLWSIALGTVCDISW